MLTILEKKNAEIIAKVRAKRATMGDQLPEDHEKRGGHISQEEILEYMKRKAAEASPEVRFLYSAYQCVFVEIEIFVFV